MAPAAGVNGGSVTAYFIPVALLGQFLIMNLFVGVLLNAFAEEDEAMQESAEDGTEEEDVEILSVAEEITTTPGVLSVRTATHKLVLRMDPLASCFSCMVADHELYNLVDDPGELNNLYDKAECKDVQMTLTKKLKRAKAPAVEWPRDYSLLVCHPFAPWRRFCVWLVNHRTFDTVVMFFIFGSTISLALDSPKLDPYGPLATTLKTLDYVWTALFSMELVLKVIANGFLIGESAYLKSGWNILDGLIVLASILVLAANQIPELQPLKALRVLRVLRPLRLISRHPGMRLIVGSLVTALPDVSSVFAVVVALQSVFAVLGMQMFSGTFASCNNPAITTEAACVGRFSGRSLRGGASSSGNDWDGSGQLHWASPSFGSFDNFGSAMKLLYIMQTGDEWEAPVFAMMGATQPGQAPVRSDYSFAAIFGIVWMFIGSFFAIELFVGVIVDSFNRPSRRICRTLGPKHMRSRPQDCWTRALSERMPLRFWQASKRTQISLPR